MARSILANLPPSIDAVCEMVEDSGVAGLPEPGEVYLVALVRRNHGVDPEHPDPWDDRIGILRRHPVGVDSLPVHETTRKGPQHPITKRALPFIDRSRSSQFAGTPEEGMLEWWSCRGTAEPGWNPMYRKGRIATNPDGCARFAVPQFARNSHGGGFHHYLPDRPAFRQVGPAHIERFDEKTGLWHSVGWKIIAANAHTISPDADWMAALHNGVGDWSHACLVSLRQDDHDTLITVGGWTPGIDDCRVSLLTLLWDAPIPTRPT